LAAMLALPLPLPEKVTKRGTLCPEDFKPSALSRAWAHEKGYDRLDLDAELEDFIDYHLGHANRWVDWDRAWKTWVRRAAQYKAVALNSGRPSLHLVGKAPTCDDRGFLRRDDAEG
jgi:hypothetical protein